MDTYALIDTVYSEAMAGAVQSESVIEELLSLSPTDAEVAHLKKRAHELALHVSGGVARIGGCIGLDFAPCAMNCSFCSFGEKWGIVQQEKVLTPDEILTYARDYVQAGVNQITLRTTEFYDMNQLCEYVSLIRENVPGVYEICLNTGELTADMATAAFRAGATSAYHVYRLGEGVDTPFDPEVRKQTMRVIAASPLRLHTGIEPIGVEHTCAELAEHIAFAASLHPESLGIKPRVNVPGTPFEGCAALSAERIAQIVAVVRLCSGADVKYVSSHPGEADAVYAGGNASNVERGATPHADSFNERTWRGVTPEDNIRILEAAGFAPGLVQADPRFCAGAHWWQPGQAIQVPQPTYIGPDGREYLRACGEQTPLKLPGRVS